jgi:hypothetical protein
MTEQKSLSRADSSGELGTNRKSKCRRSETRIVIKGSHDPVTISAAIREWVVPVLVDRFIAEHRQREAPHRSTGTDCIPSLQ